MALTSWLRYGTGAFAVATIVISFRYMYADDTPLMDVDGDPRICEFSYDEDTSAERKERIPACLALQVTTDIFSQVFFVSALSVGLTGLFRTQLAGEGEEVFSNMPAFIGLTVMGSILTVFGRAEFGLIFETDGSYHAKLIDLGFEKVHFGWVFWTNFIFLISLVLMLVVNMALKNTDGMFGMMTHMTKDSKGNEKSSNGSFLDSSAIFSNTQSK